MGAVLMGAFRWLMMTWVGVAMQKLAIAASTFVFFEFIFGYINGHSATGFGPLDLGNIITQYLQGVASPDLLDWADAFNIIPGTFLVLNALLTVFAWNMMAGSRR